MKTKSITTHIGDVEVEYHYTYTPGCAPITWGPADNWDPGSGSEIDLEGPYVAGVDISTILCKLPDHVQRKIEEQVYEQIEIQEAADRQDARDCAAELRADR